jgi:hypothetical protein
VSIALIICIISALVYLICDFAESRNLSALQELSRLSFAVAMLAWLLK